MKTIIVDCNGVCWRVKALNQRFKLTLHEKRTEIIFNFLMEILSFAKKWETNKFAFCWDSRQSFRKRIYAGYKDKSGKKEVIKTPEEIEEEKLAYAQFEELQFTILPRLGFTNNFRFSGLEADDLIASVVKNNEGDFVITSSDNDLYQLLSPSVSMYSLSTRAVISEKSFKLVYGIEPKQWIDVKILSGCKSDKVPQIPGVGVDTAIKYLTNQLSIKTKAYGKITSPEYHFFCKLNRQLVELPYNGTPTIYLGKGDPFYSINFRDVFQDYHFSTFLYDNRFAEWKNYFNLQEKTLQIPA